MSIEFQGLEELLDSLDDLTDTTNLQKALNKACLVVERSAKQKASQNKGDGELARSITSEVNGLEGIVYTPLHYAPYVEYGTGLFAEDGKGRKEVPWVYVEGSGETTGKKTVHTQESAEKAVAYLESLGLKAHITSGQKPQPYMRPALNENREKILEILKGGLLND